MITTPFSLELARDEDAISIVEGIVATVVAGKIKIFLGANVVAGSPQVYVGTLRACYRHLMNESAKKASSADVVASGDWQNASAGNIVLAADAAGLTADDVAISVAADFSTDGATHFYTETFNQLMNGLSERVSDN